MKTSDVYNSISDIWEELEATLEEISSRCAETSMFLMFLKNYVHNLHQYSNELEETRRNK